MRKTSVAKAHTDTDNASGAAARPWVLAVNYRADRMTPREMVVYAADGSVVEHRQAGGCTPAAFARHIANAALYVAAVNERG
jgi:hypothetical protein